MTTEENRIVRLPEVMRLIGPSRATVHSCHHDGTFAERLRLASQSTGRWHVEIHEWLGRASAVLDNGRQNQSARG